MKVKNFIRKSFTAHMVLPSFLTLAGSLLILIFINLYHTQKQLKELNFKKLRYELDVETASIQSKINSLIHDTSFFSSLPPVQGIIRATDNNGVDPKDGSSLEHWEKRLQNIFKEALHTHKNYIQIRYIGFHNKGKEIVRVDRTNERIKVIEKRNLQQKDIEFYYQEIKKLPQHTPYISALSFNREHGKISYPKQLVIRVAMPVYRNSKSPFGFVIINMETQNLFNSVYKLIKKGKRVYITNNTGKDLSPSNFLQSKNRSLDSVNTNIQIREHLKTLKASHSITTTESQDSFIVAKKIHYDPRNKETYIGVVVSTSSWNVYKDIYANMSVEIFFSLLLIAVSLALSFYYFRKQSKPLSTLRWLAMSFAKGEQMSIKPELLERADEMGEVSRAFQYMASEIEAKNIILNSQKKALDETALVSETDPEGKIVYINQKFSKETGYTLNEIKGKNHNIFSSGQHDKEFYKKLWDTIKAKKIWRGEVCNKRKDGTLYWVDTTIVPSLDHKGSIKGYIAIRLDITEKIKQTEELNKLTDMKSKFLSTMSHEIRNPLGAIIGLNELLSSTKLDEQQRSYVSTITSSSNSLLAIINDILDFSKLESGKLNLVLEPVDLRFLAQLVHQMFNQQASKKKLDFNVTVDKSVPKAVLADPIRIKQILTNLISNSVKFTDSGSIDLKIASHATQDKRHKLEISVEDTGIGLTDEQQRLIFTEYYQAESNHSKEFTGTGLGLSICQKLVAAMEGKIQVKSTHKVGTTFTVIIEVEETDEKPNQDNNYDATDIIAKLKKTKGNILLAEDAEVNQSLFRAMIKTFELDVKIVDNGAEAVTEAHEKDYSLIFLDLQMPVLDGKSACQKILRNYKNANKKAPWMVAITGNVFKEDRMSCYENGFDDFLGKPYRKKELKHILQNYLDKKQTLVEEFSKKDKNKKTS